MEQNIFLNCSYLFRIFKKEKKKKKMYLKKTDLQNMDNLIPFH